MTRPCETPSVSDDQWGTAPATDPGTTKGDYLTAYGDVEAAFDTFLRRIGPERGFVLIGHSQGTFHLQRLIRRCIPGLSAEDRARESNRGRPRVF